MTFDTNSHIRRCITSTCLKLNVPYKDVISFEEAKGAFKNYKPKKPTSEKNREEAELSLKHFGTIITGIRPGETLRGPLKILS